MAVSFINNASIAAAAGISTSKLGAGAVLQVVQGGIATFTSNGTGTYADTNLSASITPSSSSSKILVLVNQGGCYNTTATGGINLKLFRGATDLGIFAIAYSYATGDLIMSIPINYLDSPATTSSITYKTQFARFSTGTANVQANSNPSYIILMEIAA